jgi:hypothetical protein
LLLVVRLLLLLQLVLVLACLQPVLPAVVAWLVSVC